MKSINASLPVSHRKSSHLSRYTLIPYPALPHLSTRTQFDSGKTQYFVNYFQYALRSPKKSFGRILFGRYIIVRKSLQNGQLQAMMDLPEKNQTSTFYLHPFKSFLHCPPLPLPFFSTLEFPISSEV